MAERLRRWTANPLGSARAGSNPVIVVLDEDSLFNDVVSATWAPIFSLYVNFLHSVVCDLPLPKGIRRWFRAARETGQTECGSGTLNIIVFQCIHLRLDSLVAKQQAVNL